MNKTIASMLAVLLVLLSAADAIPPIAAEYYGTVTMDNNFVLEGTNVSIYDDNGNLCGSGFVRQQGEFGFISCNGDDPSTSQDEGAGKGENVTISVNGTNTAIARWFEGSINQLELDVKPVKVKSSIPEGIMLLPLIPIFAIIAAYLYANRKL